MRGEVGRCNLHRLPPRITPAHAGRSRNQWLLKLFVRDHPRACGEKDSHKQAQRSAVGSPPRMRGEAQKAVAGIGESGITPAHAGRSHRVSIRKSGSKDHPRACGEKVTRYRPFTSFPGSPPRMRGEVLRWSSWFVPPGITPAHAGRRQARI